MKRLASHCLAWVGLVALGLVSVACPGRGGSSAGSIAVGERAPEFSLRGLDGVRIDSGSLEGRAVILAFWATWCQPCLKEIPVLKELATRSEIEVVTIALDQEGAKRIQPFVERHGIDYTVLVGDQRVFERFNGFAIPYTLILDSALEIVSIYRGPASREAIEEDLERIG